MRTFILCAFALFLFCGCASKTPAAYRQKHASMEQESLALKKGEVKILTLPSRGASGLRLLFSVDQPGIVAVSRKEIRSMQELDSLGIKPGDPFPAFFEVKGLAAGQANVQFVERPPGADSSRDMPLKRFLVTVKE